MPPRRARPILLIFQWFTRDSCAGRGNFSSFAYPWSDSNSATQVYQGMRDEGGPSWLGPLVDQDPVFQCFSGTVDQSRGPIRNALLNPTSQIRPQFHQSSIQDNEIRVSACNVAKG